MTQLADGELPSIAAHTFEPKLAPPLPRPGLVERKVLERLLTCDAQVVAVTAPPGYGKTTLVARWASGQARAIAWLTLDHHDDDPANLLSWLAMALTTAGSPIDTSTFSTGPPTLRAVGRALAAMPPTLVVLDELQHVTAQVAIDVLTELTRYLSAGSCLVLCGRTQTVPLARLRTEVEVIEIGIDELAFGLDDARALLEGAGIAVAERDLTGLVARTEGWPVALYLAVLGVRAGVEADVGAIEGDHHLVAEYLHDQIMSTLPKELRAFLTRTSVLHELSGPLCDYVLQQSGSAAILEHLSAAGLLVLPIGVTRQWYRYHTLLREFLLADLVRAQPDDAAELRRRAGAWCAREGHDDLALDYADEAHDIDQLGSLMLRLAQPLWQTGRGVTAEKWMGRLEQRGYMAGHPEMASIWVMVLALVGRAAEAESWQVLAQAGTYDGVLPEGSSMDAWQANGRAFLCQFGPEQMKDDAGTAVRLLSPASPFLATALSLRGVAELMLGDTDGAAASFEDAEAVGTGTSALVARSVALAERAVVATEAGEWVAAAAWAETAVSMLSTRGAAYATDALVHAVTARIALHRGDTQGADAALVRATSLRPQLSYAMPYLAVQVRLIMAQCFLLRGDVDGVHMLLGEIRDVLHRRPELGRFVGDANDLKERARSVTGRSSRISTLTVAELRLLPSLSTHLSFRGIGERLFLSPHTIKTQALSIYRKLGVSSRAEAVDTARELGLLEA